MTKRTKEALDYILHHKQIKTVFQPIISLRDGSVLGHEVLSRITCKSEIENIEVLFTIAEEYNRLWDLELLCRITALEAAYKYMIPAYDKKLFINVNPNIMHYEAFKMGCTKNFLIQYNITPQDVIFEITEKHVIEDMLGFKSTINHYKGQDCQIAIDDVGAGDSGLNLISEVNPNYIKFDMNLIRDIDSDRVKFALVKGMVEFSKVSNTFLIAEGIETYEELNTLVNLGVHYGQGYLIQKPNSEVLEIRKDVLKMINEINFNRNNNSKSLISNIHIASLCTSIGSISSNEIVINIFNIFTHNPKCFGLCVIENEVPIGIVIREKLLLKLSGQYGFSLNKNKKISRVMDEEFLSVDYKTPISIVASMAMSREDDKIYDFVVVTKNDKYLGIVTIKDLLKKTSEIEISSSKHKNYLSAIADNLIIGQKLS